MTSQLPTSDEGRRAVRRARITLAVMTALTGFVSGVIHLSADGADLPPPVRVVAPAVTGVFGLLLGASFVRPGGAFRVAAWVFLLGAALDGLGAILAIVQWAGPWPLVRAVLRATTSLWLWDMMDDAHAASTDPDWTPDEDDGPGATADDESFD